jgi:hypothetical protein
MPICILPEISYEKIQGKILSNKGIEMTQLSGTIVTLPRGMNFGFIRTNNLPDHIFYFDSFGQNILNFNPIVGLEVLFESAVTKEVNEDTGRTETRTTAKNVVKKQHIKVTPKEGDHENADKYNSHKIILRILDEAFRGALSSSVFSEFEDSIFSILKILGVQHIFRFPRTEQQGKSDGFFKVTALAVIYDCTLDQNYLNDQSRNKNIQIDNYVSAL